ncbi:Kelch repeat-containing protein [Teichococcus vastitatis]|uniref:Galactose oxidase n=1 Tax=Teichococcus vastitatis TaxID=2307076 RepID=A0ABS9VZL4_9PROT|nr:kelch repeat-containing protein [Pseudoroseomonas vastitatis]MCI0752372.1 galactose oxidase [Pseudoroseomonas vastitatis]
MHRRALLASSATLLAAPALAQVPHHGIPSEQMAPLRGGGPVILTQQQLSQRSLESPAPPGPPGRWEARAPLPLPRSEMAWATAWNGRMHVVGGYAEQRVDRPYHHVYDAASDRWNEAAPLPRGANHVAVVADQGRIYALGGFTEQNRAAHDGAFVYEVTEDRWRSIAPLPRARGAAAVAVLEGRVHLIGGATDPAGERASIGWHEVYDPQADRWERRKPLPGARDHAGVIAHAGGIHVIGGRFNTFEYNTALHHLYLPQRDIWIERAAMPTPRSGHGLVLLAGRFWAMGGETGRFENGSLTGTVHGQMESYDPAADRWQSHAPMPTPRHGLGAVTLGNWIHVAGGGPVVGGGIQTSTHEAFSLG